MNLYHSNKQKNAYLITFVYQKGSIFKIFFDSATRKIGGGAKAASAKTSSVENSPGIKRSLSVKDSTNFNNSSKSRLVFENNRPKVSAFHDLHIKSHNNVRYVVKCSSFD
jgi:hypothetical protein